MHFCMHSCVYNVCLFIFPNLSYRTKDLTSTFIWLERLELCCNCNSSVAKEFSFRRIFLYTLVTKNHVLPLNIKQCPRYPSGSVESRQQFLSKLYCLLPENLEVKKKKSVRKFIAVPSKWYFSTIKNSCFFLSGWRIRAAHSVFYYTV